MVLNSWNINGEPRMDRINASEASGKSAGAGRFFLILCACFTLLFLLEWPFLFSFDLWVFKDRSSFLNLDSLLQQHHQLGVDAFYAYGLFPVFVQHLVFSVFGTGYRPLVGCLFWNLVLSAIFWTHFAQLMPRPSRWLIAIALLAPILLLVNPVLPYVFAILSIQFSLLFVLKQRLDLALAASTIGCFSVPSLPLVLAGALVVCIVVKWWLNSSRNVMELVRQLLPGVASYLLLGVVLGLFFGFKSVMATALPILGMRFYKTNDLGHFSAFLSFLYPEGESLKYYLAYYIFSTVTWFVLSTLTLVILSFAVLLDMFRKKHFDDRGCFILLSCALTMVLIFFAYGNRGQHGMYESCLAAAILGAISWVRSERYRNILLFACVAIGVLAEMNLAHKTWVEWKTTERSATTLGLYAAPELTAEWASVLQRADHQSLLMLSYATGMHDYYPSVHNPEAWFLYRGQIFPSDKQRILSAMDSSDVIVEDLTSPEEFVNSDPDIQLRLHAMCESAPLPHFRIWQRNRGGDCDLIR